MDELAAQTAADGSLGVGTDRYLAATQPAGPPPQGAAWRTVRVKFPKCARQAAEFTADRGSVANGPSLAVVKWTSASQCQALFSVL